MKYDEMKEDEGWWYYGIDNIMLKEGWRGCNEGEFLVTMLMVDYVLTILTYFAF